MRETCSDLSAERKNDRRFIGKGKPIVSLGNGVGREKKKLHMNVGVTNVSTYPKEVYVARGAADGEGSVDGRLTVLR